MKKYRTAVYYFMAFTMSSIVTYILPGDNDQEAFVDIMGVLLSLIFLGFGVAHAIINVQDEYDRSRNEV